MAALTARRENAGPRSSAVVSTTTAASVTAPHKHTSRKPPLGRRPYRCIFVGFFLSTTHTSVFLLKDVADFDPGSLDFVSFYSGTA